MKIGKVSSSLMMSADTLRYYEKIGLMPHVERNSSGVREYDKKDMSRLAFIKRAQKMHFSLKDISQLLHFRENPQQAKPQVKSLTHQKLLEIETHIKELSVLRDELTLLTNLCTEDISNCPILDKINNDFIQSN